FDLLLLPSPSGGLAFGVEVYDVAGVECVRAYAVALDLGVERRHLEVEHARGAALVSARVQERPAYEVGLEASNLVGEVNGRLALVRRAALQGFDLLQERERQVFERLELDRCGLLGRAL